MAKLQKSFNRDQKIINSAALKTVLLKLIFVANTGPGPPSLSLCLLYPCCRSPPPAALRNTNFENSNFVNPWSWGTSCREYALSVHRFISMNIYHVDIFLSSLHFHFFQVLTESRYLMCGSHNLHVMCIASTEMKGFVWTMFV